MAVHTQLNTVTLTVKNTDHTCQVLNLEHNVGGYGVGELLQLGCRDSNGVWQTVQETGEYESGTLSGEFLVDSRTTGLVEELLAARQSGTTTHFTLDQYVDNATEKLTFEIHGHVTSLVLPFEPGGKYARASFEITYDSLTVTRPTP